MKYCSKCRKISFSEDNNCECGRKFSAKLDLNQPVKLVEVDEIKKGIVEQTLVKEKIPYSEQTVSKVSPVMGVQDGRYVYYVPISFLKKSIDALGGVSAMEIPDYYEKLALPDNPEWEEMSPLKRKVIRFVSFVGFILIVFACVTAVDIITGFFMKL